MDPIIESAYARLARLDPPKRGPRYRVRVVNRSLGHVAAGHMLEVGENVITVHEDDLDALQAQVEKLEPHHERVIQEKLDRAIKDWTAQGRKAETAPYSREMFVRDVTGRDPQPFELVEVLEELGAEAPTKGSKKAG